jgi:hypothetical protein
MAIFRQHSTLFPSLSLNFPPSPFSFN